MTGGLYTVAWFSAGVSSAVATKLLISEVDEVIYTHIDDQHEDTMRFVNECSVWFGKPLTILQSPLKSVENACRCGYINGPRGASCTRLLKRRVRKEWEAERGRMRYVWGMDYDEKHRMERIRLSMPHCDHAFPLIDKKYTKEEAHRILTASGIKRPAMYELGYNNNNCIGCVKGGQGYWNKIRKDFPDVFLRRSKMERVVGASCIKGVYLDELSPTAGRDVPPIVGDCGILCETMAI